MRRRGVGEEEWYWVGTSGPATDESLRHDGSLTADFLGIMLVGWLVAANIHIIHGGRDQSLHSVRNVCLTCRSGNSP